MERPETPPWVPDDQRDTRYWIFFELYLCRIPYIQMKSVEELEQFGIPMSGHRESDYGTTNELRQIMIPISRMAEYYDRGCRISLVKYEDAKRVYQRITDHLVAWKEHLANSLNIGDAPIDDLKLLDRLANAVYDHAKYQFTDEIINGLITRMSGTRTASLTSMLGGLGRPTPVLGVAAGDDPDAMYPKRRSMADFFTRNVNPNSLNNPQASKPAPGTNNQLKTSSFADLLGRGK